MTDEEQREALNDALIRIQTCALNAEFACSFDELRWAVSSGFEAVLRILEMKGKS